MIPENKDPGIIGVVFAGAAALDKTWHKVLYYIIMLILFLGSTALVIFYVGGIIGAIAGVAIKLARYVAGF